MMLPHIYIIPLIVSTTANSSTLVEDIPIIQQIRLDFSRDKVKLEQHSTGGDDEESVCRLLLLQVVWKRVTYQMGTLFKSKTIAVVPLRVTSTDR